MSEGRKEAKLSAGACARFESEIHKPWRALDRAWIILRSASSVKTWRANFSAKLRICLDAFWDVLLSSPLIQMLSHNYLLHDDPAGKCRSEATAREKKKGVDKTWTYPQNSQKKLVVLCNPFQRSLFVAHIWIFYVTSWIMGPRLLVYFISFYETKNKKKHFSVIFFL